MIDKNTNKKSPTEKPVSLFGAKFEDVLAALLKTSKPENDEKEIKQ